MSDNRLDSSLKDSYLQSDDAVTKGRRRYGADTEAGSIVREHIRKDNEAFAIKMSVINRRVCIALICLCVCLCILGVKSIVDRSRSLANSLNELESKQFILQDLSDNPRHETVEDDADITNAHAFTQQVCDYQNALSEYVFSETKYGLEMSFDHVNLLEEYNRFKDETGLSTSNDLPVTWLSDVLKDDRYDVNFESDVFPYTWVCDNDFYKIGVETKVVWICYYNYGKFDQSVYRVVTAYYNSDRNSVSRFAIYDSFVRTDNFMYVE